MRSYCGVSSSTTITDSGVGLFRVGAPVDSIKQVCEVIRDTTVAEGREGMPERLLTVVTGPVATTATVVDDRVWRIVINSPRFRTSDSLGVGSTVGQFRAKGARLALGEGAFLLHRAHCGLSFRLAPGTGMPATLDRIPDSVRVTTVLVFGC